LKPNQIENPIQMIKEMPQYQRPAGMSKNSYETAVNKNATTGVNNYG